MRDAIIIGAGLAGSCAAILLARRGRSVTLIEQHRFPRDKVCGECLSALGIATLERLGVMPALVQIGAVPLERAVVHRRDGESFSTPLPRRMLGISRAVLDSVLLDAAHAAGVEVRQPVRCEAIDQRQASAEVRARDLHGNAILCLESRVVIIGDGKSAIPGSVPPATGDVGIKSHWLGVEGPADAIELFGCKGCYGGLAPIENGKWNVAFSVPAVRVRAHRGNIDALFTELTHENRGLARRLAGATRSGPWLASPLPRFAVRCNWPPRIIPIGNAAAALEPIGGEGMGLALASAELAVAALCAVHDWSARDALELQNQYAKLWRTRRVACRAAGWIVSSPAADVALDWINANPNLVSVAMRAMGKAGHVPWISRRAQRLCGES